MKAYWVWGIAVAAGLSAHAQECTVTAYAYAASYMPAGMLWNAERISAAMFRDIGVEVRWRADAVRAHAADDACGAPIVIQLENTGSARVSPNALAYATPFAVSGTCIHVLLDRLLEGRSGRLATTVLAHVLAHEITHVLERTDRHSANGVMKAHWDTQDFQSMGCRPLPFAAEDVELIHGGIAQRMQRILHAAAE
jgi:Zn-dependent protease with chaperone function